MTREQIYHEIEENFGLVPSMFRAIPDSSLELEWHLFKRVHMDPGPIPNKHRELIGVAVSAVTGCRYCELYHTQLAKLNGASDEEIEDALHYAKSTASWSTYLNGLQLDFNIFRDEILRACAHVREIRGEQPPEKPIEPVFADI